MSHRAHPFAISAKVYIAVWATCFGALLALIAAFPRGAGDLILVYSAGLLAVASFIAVPANLELLKYLKGHHRDQWARLVFFPNMPWNSPNSMAILQFVLTRDQLDDPVLQSLKKQARTSSLFAVCIALHLPIVWIASVILLF